MTARGTFAFVHLGCNANRADAERMARELDAAGLTQLATPQQADTIVVMTCAFTHERQQESLREVEVALNLHPKRGVIVSGCLPGIRASALNDIAGLHVVHPGRFDQAFIAKLWPPSVVHKTGWTAIGALSPTHVKRVRVSRGCAGRCAFCVIPRATGPLQSREIDKVREDVLAALSTGGREIILAGEDVGAYGRDLGTSLAALLSDLLTIEGDFQLVIESINPQWLGALLTTAPNVLNDRRVSRHWYVPLQAATDSLLRIMRRPYNLRQALTSLQRLRSLRPDTCIVTDLIVGHPGETPADVREAAALLSRFSFDYVEIMKFDAHEGAAAMGLSGQVPEVERQRRAFGLILAFVRALIAWRGITDAAAIADHLDAIPRLPVNTNLTRPELAALLATYRPMDTAEFRAAPVETVCGPWEDARWAAQLAAKVIAKIGPPRAVNLDQFEAQ